MVCFVRFLVIDRNSCIDGSRDLLQSSPPFDEKSRAPPWCAADLYLQLWQNENAHQPMGVSSIRRAVGYAPARALEARRRSAD